MLTSAKVITGRIIPRQSETIPPIDVVSGAFGGKMCSVNCENLDQDDAEPESRERIENEGGAGKRQSRVVAAYGLRYAERDGDDMATPSPAPEQEDGLWEPLGEKLSHRGVLDIRKTKVAMPEMVQVDPELVPAGLFKPCSLSKAATAAGCALSPSSARAGFPGKRWNMMNMITVTRKNTTRDCRNRRNMYRSSACPSMRERLRGLPAPDRYL